MSVQQDSAPIVPTVAARREGASRLALFRRAALGVPAYADHLRRSGIDAGAITATADLLEVPPVSKANYLSRYPLRELMWWGDAAGSEAWSTSSGSSGRPTYWPRGRRAFEESVELHDRIFQQMFDSRRRSTLVVIGFAMGNWIGGTYTYSAMLELARRGHRLSVIAPGLDAETIVTNIEELGPHFDQVVLAGYPPFVKDVVDIAGDAVLGQDLRLLLAGEAISERWRDHMVGRLGCPGDPDRVCSIYGTADMGMVGHETRSTIAVRRAAAGDGRLRDALFGQGGGLPTFVEYDEAMRFIEVDTDGRLLFTTDGTIPLIRYRINDEGIVWSPDRLRRVLRRHGHDIDVRPSSSTGRYVVLQGRSDRAVSLYAVNLYPESVRPAIEAHPERLSGKFEVRVEESEDFEQRLVVEVESRPGGDSHSRLAERLREDVAEALLRASDEYRALRAVKGDAVDPRVVIREFGHVRGPKLRLS